jgi:acetoacetyl-CoA synthetase
VARKEKDLPFEDYTALWEWSVTDIDGFWSSLWEFFDVQSSKPYEAVLGRREMPGAEWFPGAELNYAEHVFRNAHGMDPALIHASELRPLGETSWRELEARVAAFAAGLSGMGRGARRQGRRLPAERAGGGRGVSGLRLSGRVWSSASPDFGAGSVVDRFAQIEPKVLVACDGYRYGGKDFDRTDVVARLQAEIPTLQKTVLLPYLDEAADAAALDDAVLWDDVLSANEGAELSFVRVPFDHPLWVLYSSGTTGLPKAIVHSQGGILLEHLKKARLHIDLVPATASSGSRRRAG